MDLQKYLEVANEEFIKTVDYNTKPILSTPSPCKNNINFDDEIDLLDSSAKKEKPKT